MTRLVAVSLALCFTATAGAEQFKEFGDWRVHYVAFNAALLAPQIAERYGLVRGRNKGLVNVSALGPLPEEAHEDAAHAGDAHGAADAVHPGDAAPAAGAARAGAAHRPRRIALRGRFVNLLGQSVALAFREIAEGPSSDPSAVYYLAEFDFDNAETLRFEIVVELPGRGEETVRFQQALYFHEAR